MPSTRPKLPGKYPAHWEKALQFLATSPDSREVVIEERLTSKQIHTQHAKARGIRQSVRLHYTWGLAIRELVAANRLHFRRQLVDGYWQLIAYTEQPTTSVKELLQNGLANRI